MKSTINNRSRKIMRGAYFLVVTLFPAMKRVEVEVFFTVAPPCMPPPLLRLEKEVKPPWCPLWWPLLAASRSSMAPKPPSPKPKGDSSEVWWPLVRPRWWPFMPANNNNHFILRNQNLFLAICTIYSLSYTFSSRASCKRKWCHL